MHTLAQQAADALRRLALNEDAKERFCSDPMLRPWMQRVAQRYIAGQTVTEAVQRVSAIRARGHAASAEYMGESCRDAARADAETAVFLDLINALDAADLSCSISLDLSHVGAVVDPELGYRNACRIAQAAASSGREMMISAEGSDRADLVQGLYRRLHEEAGLHNVGITLQARLHRSAADLEQLKACPGRIRLVKGAFYEPESIALPRGGAELQAAYLSMAKDLLGSGRRCSIATHDAAIQQELCSWIKAQGLQLEHAEFESLIGLGGEQLNALHDAGWPTREYAVFGDEYFLYVLNRIAEEPARMFQAIIDLIDLVDLVDLIKPTADTAPA